MDGIQITRILETEKQIYYGCPAIDYIGNDELPEEEILKIVELNEGIIGPDFKHSVKLTPNLTHPSLKKRKSSRRSLDDEDVSDSTVSPVDAKLENGEKLRMKIERRHKVLKSLQSEIASLKMERKKERHELEIQKKALKKINGELRTKILLLEKYDETLKKRGRRCGGAKLRQELGITDSRDLKIAPVDTKRGRGRPKNSTVNDFKDMDSEIDLKDFLEVAEATIVKRQRGVASKIPETSDFENEPVNQFSKRRQSSLCSDTDSLVEPLKEKNLNTKALVILNKIDDRETGLVNDKTVLAEEESSRVQLRRTLPRRKSNRQMRCTEKFALMIETTPQLCDGSLVVGKIINDVEIDFKHKIEEIKKVKGTKRKESCGSKDPPQPKKSKVESSIPGPTEGRAGSSGSDSCRSIKLIKQSLMKGVASKKICEKCGDGSTDPTKCKKCFTFYHPKCVDDLSTEIGTNWICPMCVSGKNPCFVCKSDKGHRQMCLTSECGKYYHHDCLKLFPQTKFNHSDRKNVGLQMDPDDKSDPPLEILVCSRHTCHTCSSEDPIDAKFVREDKLLTCIKCPTSYHCTPGVCLTAGTEILSTSDILCGKHFEPGTSSKMISHINITWCFLCNTGGSLTCCALCPSAIHLECLKIKPPEGKYYCDECESGRFPLNGEIVWVKLGSYRWWPSKILYPDEIPPNLLKTTHRQGEFGVEFFGTHDYQWVTRGRTFIFHEKDGPKNLREHGRLDKNFKMALAEANEAFKQRQEVIKMYSSTAAKDKPHQFTKIRSNRYNEKLSRKIDDDQQHVCSCSIEDEEPCGPSSNCLNRGLLIECSSEFCPAGARCSNQLFAKRQYPALEVFKTVARGWGVRCKQDLLRGQFVIEYVGEVIDDAEMAKRMQSKRDSKNPNYYLMRLDANHVLDAEPYGNTARFINHSCRPNCETQKWTVNGLTKIGIFTREDIPKGVELTFNYDWNMPGMRSACFCGADGCSGVIGEIPKPIKAEKNIKSKKKPKPKMTDTNCYVCQTSGELVICAYEKCPRVVHKECANLTTKPSDWVCSYHLCAICGNKTKRHCRECKEAYCATHTANNIFSNSKGELYCAKHVAEKPFSNSRKSRYLSRKENNNT